MEPISSGKIQLFGRTLPEDEMQKIADKINIKTKLEVFDFNELPEILVNAKYGKVNGNAVIRIAE